MLEPKTYEISKPFVDETGKLWTIGETLKFGQVHNKMIPTLIKYGFIKENTTEYIVEPTNPTEAGEL